MAPKIAWIGLGNMGRGMCLNLVQKANLSDPLLLYNRTQARADALSEKLGTSKTKVVSSVADAVNGADIIFTCVGDDKAIQDTINAALEVDVAGKLFVDCSTVHPDTTNSLAEAISAKNAEFVACPGMICTVFPRVHS
jgi:3-hydroxyisobutyrate dehydrogenase-like beta-hydroxyacid dehydrogenase